MAAEVKTQLSEQPLMSDAKQELEASLQRRSSESCRISSASPGRGPPEKRTCRPKAEPKAEKSEHRPGSHEVNRPQKELIVPGIVDFKVIRDELRAPEPPTPGTYRFGRLSHHSFFSRHHPHPQQVTHIQDLTGKSICVVRDKFSLTPLPQTELLSPCLMGMPITSAPVGDPKSNRNPQLPSEAWKKELKDLAAQVVTFTRENELKNKEEEAPQREQGAKYSAETGRLIPASSRALSRGHSRQGRGNCPSGRNAGVQTCVLQDQELLILELLCQILQTDSLSAIQFWLVYAPPKEKDLALRLLQTAVAQLLPKALVSIPTEKLLNQLQKVQESQERQEPSCSLSPKKLKTPPLPKSEKPEYIGKAQVLRVHSSQSSEETASEPKAE